MTGPPITGSLPDEPLEIEVKLAVDRPDVVRALIDEPEPARLAGFVGTGPAVLEVLTDRYLDSTRSGGTLLQQGLRARVRESGGTHTLAVKRSGLTEGAVTVRIELQGPAGRDLDARRWPASHARTVLLDAVAGAALVEIATLRQRRLKRTLTRGDASVELSLDELEALDGDRVADRRFEIEAELLGGDRAALAELAAALSALPGVGPPLGSKLAFAVAAGTAPQEAGR